MHTTQSLLVFIWHYGSANHPNKSVIGTLQCQILHHIFKQSVHAYHTIGILYDTVGVLITQKCDWHSAVSNVTQHFYTVAAAAASNYSFQFRNLNILFRINL